MTTQLNEEEMRRALFGTTNSVITSSQLTGANTLVASVSKSESKHLAPVKAAPPKIRVTLHVSKTYEGDYEVINYDANTLSKIVAEMDAKKKSGRSTSTSP